MVLVVGDGAGGAVIDALVLVVGLRGESSESYIGIS